MNGHFDRCDGSVTAIIIHGRFNQRCGILSLHRVKSGYENGDYYKPYKIFNGFFEHIQLQLLSVLLFGTHSSKNDGHVFLDGK